MDRFLSIEAFVRVAQTQSFAEAARQLRLSKSVVTTRVQQLEELLGGPLFHRTTRAVRLSETGQAFFRDCNDLVTRWKQLTAREKELHGLMDKASQSGTGAVVGAVAYRSDYESILTEEKLVQREASDKKCELTTTFQSDQSVR